MEWKVEIFHQYELVMLITNSTVLNKLQWHYSQISALGPEGHCTSYFKRVIYVSCQCHMDVHKGQEEGQARVDACRQERG